VEKIGFKPGVKERELPVMKEEVEHTKLK